MKGDVPFSRQRHINGTSPRTAPPSKGELNLVIFSLLKDCRRMPLQTRHGTKFIFVAALLSHPRQVRVRRHAGRLETSWHDDANSDSQIRKKILTVEQKRSNRLFFKV